MSKRNLSVMIITGFLGCSALVAPSTPSWAATSISAKSSWAVSRVASVTQGSYCTMAQKYDDNSIISFARNATGEYSLALDFQSPVFKGGSSQTLTLQPGNSKKETFKVTPQSEQVVVIALGKDETFFKSIETAPTLLITLGSIDLNYKLEQFKDGRTELSTCLAGLKSPAVSPDAEKNNVAPASGETNGEIVTASNDPKKEPSVEGLLAARPKPSLGSEPISSTETSAPVTKVEAEPMVPAVDPQQVAENEKRVQDLMTENAQLKRALSQSRQDFENQLAQAQGAAVSEMKEKLIAAKSENEQLQKQVTALNDSKSQPSAETTQVLNQTQAEAKRLAQQIETLKSENMTLRNQVEIAASSKSQDDQQKAQQKLLDDKIAALQTENIALKSDLENLRNQKQELAQVVKAEPAQDHSVELDAVKNRLASIQAENQTLKNQVAQMSASSAQIPVQEDENALRKEIRTLRTQLETLEGEKAALQASFEKLQKESESGQLKSAGGSWDLEQATRRYQESQREIRRLGALLDEEHLKCTAEKKEIEAMLFDPKIADSAQISKLNSLEDSLSERDSQIKDMQAKLETMKQAASPEKDQQIAQLKTNLSEIEKKFNDAVDARNSAQSDLAQIKSEQANQAGKLDGQVAALNSQIQASTATLNEKNAKLAEMETQIASLQKSAQAGSAETNIQLQKSQADIATLKAQLAEKESKVASLESRLLDTQKLSQEVHAAQTPQKSNDALVATLKEELVQRSSELGQAQAKLISLQGELAQHQAQIKVMQQQSQSVAQQVAYVQPSYGAENATVSAAVDKADAVLFPSAQQYTSFLKTAGVPLKGGLSEVSGGESSSYKAYSWKTQSLYGSVEMRKTEKLSAFDSVVSQYLARAKSRCNGDFAAVPSQTKAAGAVRSVSYEIACVGQGSSSSASVLFTYEEGILATVAHEGRAEAMDLAIDARDKVAQSFR